MLRAKEKGTQVKRFSFRFDIDSLADIEVGVPRLLDSSKELGARFTFFVNMGRSFSWKPILRDRQKRVGVFNKKAFTVISKLGLMRTIRTVVQNPCIGSSHKDILFRLLDAGHELALHGGMDHPLWQWGLSSLDKGEIDEMLRPAYARFEKLFGRPEGFSSPGFQYNNNVLELVDDYEIRYASDMKGENLFVPEGHRHVQVPVNIMGPSNVPLLESLYASGRQGEEVLGACKGEILKRNLAVMYGHPSFEGRLDDFSEIISWVKGEGYSIMTLGALCAEEML